MSTLTTVERKHWLRRLTRGFLNFDLADSLKEAFEVAKESVDDPVFREDWKLFEWRTPGALEAASSSICRSLHEAERHGIGFSYFAVGSGCGPAPSGLDHEYEVSVPDKAHDRLYRELLVDTPEVNNRLYEWIEENGLPRPKDKASKSRLARALVALRFRDEIEYRKWLERHHIPHSVWSYFGTS